MKLDLRIKLMLMMFLMFVTWGSWYGQMGKYLFTTLKATGDQIGLAYTTFSIASIAAPFFMGLIADRFFSAQKVMGVLNILGAVILYFLIQVKSADTFIWYILAYTLTFAPNLALSSSIAMNQMKNPEKEFPTIRVMGTVAWIVITNIIGYFGVGDKVEIFQIAMVTSLAWGLFAFTLPDTPPKATKATSFGQILGTDAFVLFKDRSFLVFFISSILVCIPLSFYYAHANLSLTESHMTNVENKMSLGQVSEVLFMLLIPFALTRFGIKKMLIVGLIAWIIRFICFGYGDGISSEWVLYIAIVLHGVCYDFFFVTGQIYTDNKAGEKIKSSAQGLITLATYGVGMAIGSLLSGRVLDIYTTKNAAGESIHNWQGVWMVPAGIAAAVLVFFVLIFKDNTRKAK
ncbi:nucleoside permease [Emticicia sp. 21SJ11W-3]|uniref:nucleoside permease n=1 Tax=Emticicia sp. 21SJ11W-3 TaxID=2916755 RepID=UPI0020A099E1|nr:nucleoside permease [Emticicia sp. 21SJ11W-3]UTA69996.1 nucleoside permease [Emticicia sp. 21SJ11W-3]